MSENFPQHLQFFLDTAITAADRAREVTLKWFRTGVDISSKEDKTPVTIADMETEMIIRETIFDSHPDHGFFGEETGRQKNGAEWQWVIDPIDGTRCFATGMPTFGTLIALLHQGNPVIGIIDHGALDERWVGVGGRATTHNGAPCRTRATSRLADATVYTTTTDMFDEQTAPRAERLTGRCRFRVFGGDCYSYGLTALGLNDIVCEADLKPYDFFALIPVLQGAGGVITDWQGHGLTMDSKGEVLACANKTLLDAAVERLNG